MNKIYTSYFSGIKKYELDISKCVSIARFSPKGINIRFYQALCPTQSILSDYKSGAIDEREYEERYIKEVLSKLDAKKVADNLNGKILLCYEKSEIFCHRHIVASWLQENGCAIVEEIQDKRYL